MLVVIVVEEQERVRTSPVTALDQAIPRLLFLAHSTFHFVPAAASIATQNGHHMNRRQPTNSSHPASNFSSASCATASSNSDVAGNLTYRILASGSKNEPIFVLHVPRAHPLAHYRDEGRRAQVPK